MLLALGHEIAKAFLAAELKRKAVQLRMGLYGVVRTQRAAHSGTHVL